MKKWSLCNHDDFTENRLLEHLKSIHKVERLRITSFQEFKNWKQKIEAATRLLFVKIMATTRLLTIPRDTTMPAKALTILFQEVRALGI